MTTARAGCPHQRLTVTFDLAAGTVQVGCSSCYGTWPEPDTPPDLMDRALIEVRDLIRSRIIRRHGQG